MQKKENDRENFYQRYKLDKNKKSIISVGLFIERKGILDFVELAKKLAIKGDDVLLSPACASWDMYKSYEVRGQHFKDLVKELM